MVRSCRLQLVAPLSIAGAIFLTVAVPITPLAAMSLVVSERQIISLANAPALRAADPMIDDAGRPVLRVQLEFANECYADTGVRAALFAKSGGGASLTLGQSVPSQGCPDIFQPALQSLDLVLPPSLRGAELSVVARPTTEGVVRRMQMDDLPRATLEGAETLELDYEEEVLPLADSADVEAIRAAGYLLTASFQLAEQCREDDLRALVFEAPDPQGTPRSDIVLVTAPPGCANASTSDIFVRIETPQPPQGRSVVLLNGSSPRPIPLPD